MLCKVIEAETGTFSRLALLEPYLDLYPTGPHPRFEIAALL